MYSTHKARILKCSLQFLPSTLITTRVRSFFCQRLIIQQCTLICRLDLNLFVQQFKYIRTLLETEPWKSAVVTEANPGSACKTDEQIKGTLRFPTLSCHQLPTLLIMPSTEYIKQTFLTTWRTFYLSSYIAIEAKKHYIDTVGSCSMVPRHKNGVVDPQLRVYGTTNVRVVDISIMPLHVAAHTQSE